MTPTHTPRHAHHLLQAPRTVAAAAACGHAPASGRSRRWAATLALAAAAVLAGCTTTNPDVVSRNEAQRLSTVTDAVVLSTRSVVVDGSQSGIGAAAGSVIGGVSGGSVGGRRESVAVGVLGAVLGGVIGNAAERAATREEALEILVQLRNGDRRSVVQAKGDENFAAGDAVILINTGGKVRVTKAPPVQAPADPSPTANKS